MCSVLDEYSCHVVLPEELEVKYSSMAFKFVASGFALLKDVVESCLLPGILPRISILFSSVVATRSTRMLTAKRAMSSWKVRVRCVGLCSVGRRVCSGFFCH